MQMKTNLSRIGILQSDFALPVHTFSKKLIRIICRRNLRDNLLYSLHD